MFVHILLFVCLCMGGACVQVHLCLLFYRCEPVGVAVCMPTASGDAVDFRKGRKTPTTWAPSFTVAEPVQPVSSTRFLETSSKMGQLR